jgi:hypothetical protein
MGFDSNINNILTKKGEFGGVKNHDGHTYDFLASCVGFFHLNNSIKNI